MQHPAEGVFGMGLVSRLRLMQPGLRVALLASVMLHGILLSQVAHRATPPPHEPEPAPSALVAHLWLPAPSLQLPPVAPNMPAEQAIADPQNARHTARQPPLNVVNASSAATHPSDTQSLESQEPPQVSAPSGLHTDRPLDLSPQVISQAARRNASPSLAQAAREQLGNEPAPAAARLGQHIASGAVPDCLHNAPEGEGKPGPVAIGGLFALPFVAYTAMTGKCR